MKFIIFQSPFQESTGDFFFGKSGEIDSTDPGFWALDNLDRNIHLFVFDISSNIDFPFIESFLQEHVFDNSFDPFHFRRVEIRKSQKGDVVFLEFSIDIALFYLFTCFVSERFNQ